MESPVQGDYTSSASQDSLVGSIADWVARAIIEGRLHPGEDLSSVELSRRFRSSRTPVREALVLLANQGLIAIEPRRSPRVAEVRLSDVRDLYELRAVLYGLASELIVERASAEELATLWACHHELADAHAAGDVDRYFWANVRFRDTEVEISRNLQLKKLLDGLRLRTHQLRHFSLSLHGRLDRSLIGHEMLLRAYDARDARLAVAVNRWIVGSALRAIEGAWDSFTAGTAPGSSPASLP
ncbi:MAG TPA: GntR family transcriptional regulator [Candidatus Limnocylindria bacterium]|jgi:DNA-binding GntR family transcriptional regulator|nr:GntR family transcriptional regulator [Candidatus Limnocylindria bacterium]